MSTSSKHPRCLVQDGSPGRRYPQSYLNRSHIPETCLRLSTWSVKTLFFIPPIRQLYLTSSSLSHRSNAMPNIESSSNVLVTRPCLNAHSAYSFLSRKVHGLFHLQGNSLNTFLNTSRPLNKFRSLSLSLSRCAASLAWPHGKCAAGASNSFSRNLIAGIEPPSRM